MYCSRIRFFIIYYNNNILKNILNDILKFSFNFSKSLQNPLQLFVEKIFTWYTTFQNQLLFSMKRSFYTKRHRNKKKYFVRSQAEFISALRSKITPLKE